MGRGHGLADVSCCCCCFFVLGRAGYEIVKVERVKECEGGGGGGG